MKKYLRWAVPLLAVLLAGCMTRSISNADNEGGYGRSALYQGELSEFDVLGIERGAKPSDADIASALDARKALSLKRGSSLMLIQSGAMMPDDPMTKALEKYYAVVPFSGVPSGEKGSADSYSRSLRLAAARSGSEKLLVYWGVLESGRENLATSAVSWVPVIGWVLPDERQRMRIKLKLVIVDVRSGQWEIYSPESLDDKAYSSILSRRESDQVQVALLKDKSYAAAAEDLYKRYGR